MIELIEVDKAMRGGNAVKIEAITGDRLRIWLSDTELEKWGIRYPAMTVRQPATRRLLQTALTVAKRRVGFHADGLLLESLPVAGGCLLLLTARPPCGAGPVVIGLADLDAVYGLAERWYPDPAGICPAATQPATALYEWNGQYALAVYPFPELSERQERLLGEFGFPLGTGEAAAAAVAERGRLLAAGNALERLTGRMPVAAADLSD